MNCAVHPERAAVGPCERCGNFSCGECLVQQGTQKLCGPCRSRVSELEWDRRGELGLFRAWWLTSKRVSLSPIQTFAVITPEGSLFESLLYGGLSTLAGFLPTLFVYLLVLGGVLAVGGLKDAKIGLAAGTGIGVMALLIYLVMLVLFSVVFILISSGFEVVVARLFGARDARYEVAVRAHALSMAVYVAGVIPICSLYVFPIWALVLRVFAIERLHRTTSGVAVASALIPIALCCALGGGSYAAFIAFAVLASKH